MLNLVKLCIKHFESRVVFRFNDRENYGNSNLYKSDKIQMDLGDFDV